MNEGAGLTGFSDKKIVGVWILSKYRTEQYQMPGMNQWG